MYNMIKHSFFKKIVGLMLIFLKINMYIKLPDIIKEISLILTYSWLKI